MSTYKSMSDAAYEIMSKKKRSIAFIKLWEEVMNETKVSEDLVAQFYSDLTLDSRFVQLKDNKWDLRSRRKFEEHYVDISKIDLEDDEESAPFDLDALNEILNELQYFNINSGQDYVSQIKRVAGLDREAADIALKYLEDAESQFKN